MEENKKINRRDALKRIGKIAVATSVATVIPTEVFGKPAGKYTSLGAVKYKSTAVETSGYRSYYNSYNSYSSYYNYYSSYYNSYSSYYSSYSSTSYYNYYSSYASYSSYYNYYSSYYNYYSSYYNYYSSYSAGYNW